jgi:hypothetical protein
MSLCRDALADLAIPNVLGDVYIDIRPVIFPFHQLKGSRIAKIASKGIIIIYAYQCISQVTPRGDINTFLKSQKTLGSNTPALKPRSRRLYGGLSALSLWVFALKLPNKLLKVYTYLGKVYLLGDTSRPHSCIRETARTPELPPIGYTNRFIPIFILFEV